MLISPTSKLQSAIHNDSEPGEIHSDSEIDSDSDHELEDQSVPQGGDECTGESITANLRPPNTNSRYRLRKRVAAPVRLMEIRSGRAISEGRVM